jgi:hypothetical protein
MATEYSNGNNAVAALVQAAIDRGLDPTNRLVGEEAVAAEVLANLLNGEIPLGSEGAVAPGAGTAGVGGFLETAVERVGALIRTTIAIDLTGLASSAAGDIIGLAAGGAAYIGRITAAVNGTILAGYVQCVETPAGGEPDVDLFAATAATGVYDAAISGLAGQAALMEAAADWTGILAAKGLTAVPAANAYLYLVASGGGDAAAYTGGKFLIVLYGRPA